HRVVVGPAPIVGLAPAGDIRRQWHVAAVVDGLIKHRPVKGERQGDLAAIALAFDRGVELTEEADPALLAEPDDIARRKLFCRPYKRTPARAIDPFGQCRFDLRLGVAPDA